MRTLATMIFSLLVTIGLSSCKKSNSNKNDSDDSEETSEQGLQIEDEVDAMASIPSTDPSGLDYANVGTLTTDLQLKKGKLAEEKVLTIKVTHVPGEGLGKYQVFQCANASQIGFAELAVKDDVYTGKVYFRGNNMNNVAATIDINSTITAGKDVDDENFSGIVDVKFNSSARLVFHADGSKQQNFLQGNNGMATTCRWDKDKGCALREGREAIPFVMSVASNGRKTFSSTSDDSFCKDLDFTTRVKNDSMAKAEKWDCTLPSEATWIDLESSMDLEDAGGTHCQTASDIWESTNAETISCSLGATASAMGCYCDHIYTIAVQEVRLAERQFVCKAKGIFNLIKDGTVATEFKSGDTIYLRTTVSR